MRVTLLLADSAQAVEGKLYVLGGGWSVTAPGTPSAIAIKVEVPWHEANRPHRWELSLLDADGTPVETVSADGSSVPITISGQFEMGRPPGLPEGVPLDLPIAINLGPLPVQPGGRYVWQFAIDGETDASWTAGFTVRRGPGPQARS